MIVATARTKTLLHICLRRFQLKLYFYIQVFNQFDIEKIFNMKISQAVLLLSSSSSAEKVIVDRTVQLHLPVPEDGVRSGKRVTLYEPHIFKKLVRNFQTGKSSYRKKNCTNKIFQKIYEPKQIESI